MEHKDGVDELLVELYNAGNPFLENYPWEFEEDRWSELLTCSLMIGLDFAPEQARDSVDTIRTLGVGSARDLASATPETKVFVQEVLGRLGCETDQAKAAVNLMVALATIVNQKWGGYVQRFLRDHGSRMAQEFGADLKSTGVPELLCRKIAVLWLQNVANIPLLLPSDQYIEEFCKDHNLTNTELLDAADRLGLNVSVLDDLLNLEAMAGDPEISKERKSTKRAAG